MQIIVQVLQANTRASQRIEIIMGDRNCAAAILRLSTVN